MRPPPGRQGSRGRRCASSNRRCAVNQMSPPPITVREKPGRPRGGAFMGRRSKPTTGFPSSPAGSWPSGRSARTARRARYPRRRPTHHPASRRGAARWRYKGGYLRRGCWRGQVTAWEKACTREITTPGRQWRIRDKFIPHLQRFGRFTHLLGCRPRWGSPHTSSRICMPSMRSVLVIHLTGNLGGDQSARPCPFHSLYSSAPPSQFRKTRRHDA
jgi:hypothetical protein